MKNSGYYSTDCESGYPFPLPPEGTAGAVEGVSDYTSCGGRRRLPSVRRARQYAVRVVSDQRGQQRTALDVHHEVASEPDLSARGTRRRLHEHRRGRIPDRHDAVQSRRRIRRDAGQPTAISVMPCVSPCRTTACARRPTCIQRATTARRVRRTRNAIPYGARLRLKTTFAGGKSVATFSTNESVRVILRTLQKYGMFLSDGGDIPLIADDGMFSTQKWDDLQRRFARAVRHRARRFRRDAARHRDPLRQQRAAGRLRAQPFRRRRHFLRRRQLVTDQLVPCTIG